ncbi:MAG: DEAD/DEAH box helicase family protein [Planctomycetaceae bacterium]|jgi:predicted helicase|nr:DEAD/DEAH box helicase family protein [Planctomycetaceae bacterium]
MGIDSIISRIIDVKLSDRDKGSRFEEVVQIYLSEEPEYKVQYKNVFLWDQWDRRTAADTGIDLVAEMRDGSGFVAVQCKCFDSAHKIQKSDIDSFLAVSSKRDFVRRILVITSELGKNAADAIRNQEPPVHVIDLLKLRESKIDWDLYFADRKVRLKPTKRLRPHQVDAVAKVIDGFQTADRGQLIMACGTGKTFTSLKVAESFVGKGGLVLFLVPSLSLMSQTLREWLCETGTALNCYGVCSDEKIGKHDEDSPLSLDDLAIPATTDGRKLADSFCKMENYCNDKLTVVFSTYQSIDAINVAQNSGLREFDLAICDEAHRTTGAAQTGDDESQFVRIHDPDFIKAKKRLYMTATPRLYSAAAKETAKSKEIAVWSMDNEEFFGNVFYHLGFSQAVSEGLLSDYKVVILGVNEDVFSSEMQEAIPKKRGAKSEMPMVDPAKIIGCWNALAGKVAGKGKVSGGGQTSESSSNIDSGNIDSNSVAGEVVSRLYEPLHRAVAFTTSINQSKNFAEKFTDIIVKYHAGLPDNLAGDLDVLNCEVRHVDGTQNAIERNKELDWLKREVSSNECRILSNARCLSEGVDVPALDAVLFLTPRKSQVDVVQSVGRVMRKAEGKNYGYVILPVVIPAGVDPVAALNDSEAYDVVWSVLQALRAHDDRFNRAINIIELNENRPESIVVDVIGSKRQKSANRDGIFDDIEKKTNEEVQQYLSLNFEKIENWRNAIYAKIVQKCGEKPYWEEWANFVAEYALHYMERIGQLIGQNEEYEIKLRRFRADLETDLATDISDGEVIEMLAQHLITKPVFEALFGESPFTQSNPVSQSLNELTDLLNDAIPNEEADKLQKFYRIIKSKAEGIDNIRGKQKIVLELYDRFFKTAFSKMAERLGIVYTPVEVVDFIINSVDVVLREQFDSAIGAKDVHVLDPFTGTGTFIVRLLQSGLIDKKDLLRKYKNELHANEIVLLAYYIAAINIEETFHEIYYQDNENKNKKNYIPFENILFTDTFNVARKDQFENVVTLENQKRIRKQRKLPIQVIIGNPPYSTGQKSENDNNKNQVYSDLDKRISETYAEASTATNKRNLYDSYIRAVRWSSDRIGDKGVIGFVSNGSYIDTNSMDGLRKCLAEEFTDIYVFNCRGNARTSGELRRKEGGSVFGEGTRTPVTITIFVKNPNKKKDK